MPPDFERNAPQAGRPPPRHWLMLAAVLVSLAGIGLPAWAQAGPFTDGMTVREALQVAERDGLHIVYNDDLVDGTMRITAPTAGTVTEQLAQILKPHGLTLAQVADGIFAVIPYALPGTVARTGSVLGRVVDAIDGTGIEGAEVSLTGTGRQVRAGRGGGFSLVRVSPGDHELVVTFAPARRERRIAIHVEAGKPVVVTARLQSVPLKLDQVIVMTSRYALDYDSPSAHSVLTAAELANMPRTGQETLRAVHRLPGSAANGVSAQSHVRGGALDETLILLDGLELIQPLHLKQFYGPFSAIDSHLIGSIDYYTGAFGAEYGDRMSSVMDLHTLAAPAGRYVEFGASPFNTSVLAGTEFDDGNGQWFVSGRRGNLDVVARKINSEIGIPEFFDAMAQLRYAAGNGTDFRFSYLRSQDEIAFNNSAGTVDASARYRNDHVWARIGHEWSAKLSTDLLVARSTVDNRRSGRIDDPAIRTGSLHDVREAGITETAVTIDWLGDDSLLRGGFRVRRVDSDYDFAARTAWATGLDLGDLVVADIDRTARLSARGTQSSAFASYRFRPLAAMTAELGLRWTDESYSTDPQGAYVTPRVNVLYELSPATRLRAGWGRFVQPQSIDELPIGDGVTGFYPAQRAEHAVAGIDHLAATGVRIRLEGYYKDIDAPWPRYENLLDPVVLLPELEPDRVRIVPERAFARGVELHVSSGDNGPWNWWGNVAWSEVRDRVDGRNVRRTWDQAATVNAGLSRHGVDWDVDIAATWRTGWPQTPASVGDEPEARLVVGERNSERYRSFHSLDARVTRRFRSLPGTFSAFAELTNAYSNPNACCTELDLSADPPYVSLQTGHWPGLVPSIGFLWRFESAPLNASSR